MIDPPEDEPASYPNVLLPNSTGGTLIPGSPPTGSLIGHALDFFGPGIDSNALRIPFQTDNIILTEVMTLLGVQRDIRAHKAMLTTNTGYSHTAISLAQENGIALLIVRPAPGFDVAVLPQAAAPVVAQALEKIAPGLPCVYHLNIVHRGLEPKATAPAAAPFPRPRVPVSPRLLPKAPFPNKMIPSPAKPQRAPGPFGIRRK